jgi:hypothetical protein
MNDFMLPDFFHYRGHFQSPPISSGESLSPAYD